MTATPRRVASREAGLTLLETLIVLAVIAVASGATLLALAPRRGDATGAEARQLAATIQLAADRAVATGAAAALVVDDHGYAVRGDARAEGSRHDLPAGIALGAVGALPPAGGAGTPPAGGAGALPLGDAARSFELHLDGGGSDWTVAFDGLRAVAAPAVPPR